MRALILVIDAFGIGALPDASRYGDDGADTLRSVCLAETQLDQVQWPTLRAMGLGNCKALLGAEIANCAPVPHPTASFGVMAERSTGKDTTTGHWELAGIVLAQGFHTFVPEFPSFPKELVSRFETETGYTLIGNRSASGTAIIEEFGMEQMMGKRVICYTSADSVFQIAAHEEVVRLEQLYQICETARTICDDYRVARVIARPFTGTPGNFTRTAGRHDYSIELPGPTILDKLQEHNIETIGIGKIGDIFNQQGVSLSYPDKGNAECLQRVEDLLSDASRQDQLLFVNLVDTDMLYGHRRDAEGYYRAIGAIDRFLPKICKQLNNDDLLIITADHGCDPTFSGTDHTREYVPLLVYRAGLQGSNLGIRNSFCDVAATIGDFFGIENEKGDSVLNC